MSSTPQRDSTSSCRVRTKDEGVSGASHPADPWKSAFNRTRRVGEVLFSILEIFELSRTQKALAKLVSHSRLQGGWVGGWGWAQS